MTIAGPCCRRRPRTTASQTAKPLAKARPGCEQPRHGAGAPATYLLAVLRHARPSNIPACGKRFNQVGTYFFADAYGLSLIVAPRHRTTLAGDFDERKRMKIELMEDLYLEELRDLYDAEKQLLKILPKMAKAVQAPELRDAFTRHVEETKAQVQRLEEIFKRFEEEPEGKKCKAMKGLIAEAKDYLSEEAEPELVRSEEHTSELQS